MVVDGDQCPFGQWAEDADGWAVAKKPTRWMTNSRAVADAVAIKCSNEACPAEQGHRHVLLIGGKAGLTERYPPRLVTAILKGLRRDMVESGLLGSLDAGPTVEEPDFDFGKFNSE